MTDDRVVARARRVRARSSAVITMIWSPSTSSPCSSTAMHTVGVAVEREPERRAPCSTTARCSDSGYVEPQSSLMLRPSGSALQHVDLAHRGSRNARGASSDAAPFAQSSTTCSPASVRPSSALQRGARRTASTVRASASKHRRGVADASAAGSVRASALELGLDRRLGLVGELAAVGADDLHAVVGPRVVARRDDRRRHARARAARNAIAGVGTHTERRTRRACRDACRARGRASMRGPELARVAPDDERRSAPSTRATARPSATTRSAR